MEDTCGIPLCFPSQAVAHVRNTLLQCGEEVSVGAESTERRVLEHIIVYCTLIVPLCSVVFPIWQTIQYLVILDGSMNRPLGMMGVYDIQ